MARVSITEFKAKTLLLENNYKGIHITSTHFEKKLHDLNDNKTYIIKVDQGEKKRMKRGLLKISSSKTELESFIKEKTDQGFTTFLIEEFLEHNESDEKYFSIERIRNGYKVLFSNKGGIDVENTPNEISTYNIAFNDFTNSIPLPEHFLKKIIEKMDNLHISFIECNPLLAYADTVILLDCAMMVDSAASFFVSSWDEQDFTYSDTKLQAEINIEQLNATTPASLKLNVLNPNGTIFLMLSGGGGSLVVADEAYNLGFGNQIGNYGEYSGAPSRGETYLYAKEIIELLLHSGETRKALVVAGATANFTDVYETFLGIMDALKEYKEDLVNQHVKVFVRRDGPNSQRALEAITDFLKDTNLFGSVNNSDLPLTISLRNAIEYVSN